MCRRTEGAHDGFKIVVVLMPDVLLDELEARRDAVRVRARHVSISDIARWIGIDRIDPIWAPLGVSVEHIVPKGISPYT
jgi:hypothetical protein